MVPKVFEPFELYCAYHSQHFVILRLLFSHDTCKKATLAVLYLQLQLKYELGKVFLKAGIQSYINNQCPNNVGKLTMLKRYISLEVRNPRRGPGKVYIKVELQWLEHLCDYENLFEH